MEDEQSRLTPPAQRGRYSRRDQLTPKAVSGHTLPYRSAPSRAATAPPAESAVYSCRGCQWRYTPVSVCVLQFGSCHRKALADAPGFTPPAQDTRAAPAETPRGDEAGSGPGLVGMMLRRGGGELGVRVESLTPGLPAAACGRIRVGDQLLAVDGRHVNGLALPAVHALINGPAGAGIELRLRRADSAGPDRRGAGAATAAGGAAGAGPQDLFGVFSSACYSLAAQTGGGSKGGTPRPSLEQARYAGLLSGSPAVEDSGEYLVALIRAAPPTPPPARRTAFY